ncbi:MAG: cobalamin biosynthesis protein [Faecalibacterium sp.]
MKIAIYSYSDRGCQLAVRIAAFYQAQGDTATCYAIAKFANAYQLTAISSTSEGVAEQFGAVHAIVFVGACGIAVRALAPLLKSKTQDPACLVVDDGAQFVIPLVSGHIGGANAQAQLLARALGACPVVTTATDVNHRFSVDAFAAQRGFAISSMADAKAFSAQILTCDLPLFTCPEVSITSPLGAGLYLGAQELLPENAKTQQNTQTATISVQESKEKAFVAGGQNAQIGLLLGYSTALPGVDLPLLRLIPPMLTLGIGCKKGTIAQQIETLVQSVLTAQQIDPAAVRCVASIDLKAQEPGLLAFCKAQRYALQCYSAAQLQAVQGDFTASAFVQSITGVDNVCERAAILAAQGAAKPISQGAVQNMAQISDHSTVQMAQNTAHLICRKISRDGVTLAIAAQELEVCFG